MIAAGCPVSWTRTGAAETLRSLLKQAGFPPIFTISEPVGAAFHFLGGQLRAQDFHRDIVVFDWGAGTFDMTVLRAGRMDFEGSMTWGSTLYGGRLFDDLFYQWLIEMVQKRGRQSELDKLNGRPTERAILLGLTCRKIKEGFSRHYAGQAPERPWTWPTPLVLGSDEDSINLGNFFVQSIDEFEQRMRTYRPSPEARRWIEMSTGEVEPEEREFVEKLKAGGPVDLEAWGLRLVDTGLKKLAVGEGATAVLTGGSCNWRWFLEHVRSIPPFQGRSTSVLRDSRPELTIARGLARAYAVGSYSKQLVSEINGLRDQLVPQIQSVHAELLDHLSLELTSLMRADDKLQIELRNMFKDALGKIAPPPVQGLREQGVRLLNLALKDPVAEAIRPDLEKRIGLWLVDNQQKVGRWAQRFSIEANQRVMALLKRHINAEIGGLVEVAIEACNATGQTPFDEALQALGGAVRFESNMVVRVLDEITGMIPPIVKRLFSALQKLLGMAPAGGPQTIDDQAQQFVTRFFEAMPAAVRSNVLRVQTPEQWAERVIDHLIETLGTLVRIARVDEAERMILETV